MVVAGGHGGVAGGDRDEEAEHQSEKCVMGRDRCYSPDAGWRHRVDAWNSERDPDGEKKIPGSHQFPQVAEDIRQAGKRTA